VRRREFITLLGGAANAPLLATLTAHAQQPFEKFWRLGVLETNSRASNSNFDAFQQEMHRLGYVEGKNLVIEYRSVDGRAERYAELAAELVRLKTDAILTRGTPATRAVRDASATTPVVMTAVAEPLLVATSLARPGGNVTGLSSLVAELFPKRLELLMELVPGIARVAHINNMGNPPVVSAHKEFEAAARSRGLQSQIHDVRKPEDIAPAFAAASVQHADALILGIDGVLDANRRLLAELAVQYRLPAIYASREFVEAGGLITYGVHYADLYRRAAVYVDKIFKGEKPADLPIEQPTRLELIINLKAAKTISLTIPESFLLRADEVIE
jgi:putative ABC transport system substrate-binding protein